MYTPMPAEQRQQARTALGLPHRPASDNQVIECAIAVQQMRDPEGPGGDDYDQLRIIVRGLAPWLAARLLDAEDEIERLKAENAGTTAGSSVCGFELDDGTIAYYATGNGA